MLGSPLEREVVCVFFDFQAADCKRRAAARENHPTIRKGGGARIIDAQARQIERPQAAEGFGTVEVVRSFDEAEALLRRYGVDAGIIAASQAAVCTGSEEVAVSAAEGEPDAADGGGIDTRAAEELQREVSGFKGLPDGFACWLREELEKEIAGADLEGIFAAVEVILVGAELDPDALGAASEVLRDAGAPRCAESLPEQWSCYKQGDS
jgi:hypothetical protein